MFTAAPSDADLVQRSLTGGTPAFAEIVARYQTLVCSLAYNATGSLSRSEDLAQEVFLTAWKELRQLREPEKLRPWLCGIARRLVANVRRREGREPVCAAEELEDEHHAAGPGPVEQTISREEEAILWRSLAQIPETYREPLILFYREGQSVARVASALELTEDAAKQRLSRGRKLLQEQVALFVEGALRQSTPGRAFTLGVIAALPLLTASASAASIGTAVVKGGAAATGAGWLAISGVLLGPVVGCLGAWFGVKASLEGADSERERALIRRQARQMIALVLGFLGLMGAAIALQTRIGWRNSTFVFALYAGLPILYGAALGTMIYRFRRAHARMVFEEAPRRDPEAVARRAAAWKTFEYKSRWTLLGLPLVHVRTGQAYGEKLRPAVGWIAIGDVSIGVLVSIGALAVGGLSIGGLSVGYLAYGGCALAWHAAGGGMAAAFDFALGGVARAAHANDAVSEQAIDALGFFQFTCLLTRHPLWQGVAWIPLLLIPWQAMRARKALKGQKAK
jgi:RNA polymerase sigma factor (sigma-70 family)